MRIITLTQYTIGFLFSAYILLTSAQILGVQTVEIGKQLLKYWRVRYILDIL